MVALQCVPRLVNFGLYKPLRSTRHKILKKMTRVNSLRHVLFPMPARPRPNTVRYGNWLSNAMPQSFNPLAP